MRRKSTAKMECSIARTLDVVGEWWTLLIVRDLGFNDLHRFEQLQQNLGIARNVLTVRLQKLIDSGIVEARLYQERPPRSEYHLTAKGRDLGDVLLALLSWGDRWTRDGTAPPIAVNHAACGHGLITSLTCPECDVVVPVDSRRIVRRSDVPAALPV